MKNNINLSLGQAVQGNEVRKSFIASIAFFVIVFLAGSVLLVYQYFLNKQYTALLVRESQMTLAIQSLGEKKAKIIMLADRLDSIDNLMSKRKELIKNYISVVDIMPENIEVKDVSLEKNEVSIQVQSESLASLNTFLERLYTLDQSDSKIEIAKLNSFTTNDNGQYAVSFSFAVGKI